MDELLELLRKGNYTDIGFEPLARFANNQAYTGGKTPFTLVPKHGGARYQPRGIGLEDIRNNSEFWNALGSHKHLPTSSISSIDMTAPVNDVLSRLAYSRELQRLSGTTQDGLPYAQSWTSSRVSQPRVAIGGSTYPAHTNPIEYGSAMGGYADEQPATTYPAHTNPIEYGSAMGGYADEQPAPTAYKVSNLLETLAKLNGIRQPVSNTPAFTMSSNLKPLVPTTLGLGLGLPPQMLHIKAGIPDKPKTNPVKSKSKKVQTKPVPTMVSTGPQLRVVTGPDGKQSLAYSANHMYNQASLQERRLNDLRKQQVMAYLAGKGMTYEQALAQARGY